MRTNFVSKPNNKARGGRQGSRGVPRADGITGQGFVSFINNSLARKCRGTRVERRRGAGDTLPGGREDGR